MARQPRALAHPAARGADDLMPRAKRPRTGRRKGPRPAPAEEAQAELDRRAAVTLFKRGMAMLYSAKPAAMLELFDACDVEQLDTHSAVVLHEQAGKACAQLKRRKLASEHFEATLWLKSGGRERQRAARAAAAAAAAAAAEAAEAARLAAQPAPRSEYVEPGFDLPGFCGSCGTQVLSSKPTSPAARLISRTRVPLPDHDVHGPGPERCRRDGMGNVLTTPNLPRAPEVSIAGRTGTSAVSANTEHDIGPGAYAVGTRQAVAGGRFSMSVLPSEADKATRRAASIPASCDYIVPTEMPRGGRFSATRTPSGLDLEIARAASIPASCDYIVPPEAPRGGRFGKSDAKSSLEMEIHRSRGVPAPDAYAVQEPVLSGGKFNSALPKSDIDWACHRAARSPAPHDYQRPKFPRAVAASIGVRTRSSVDYALLRAAEVPGPSYDCRGRLSAGSVRMGDTATGDRARAMRALLDTDAPGPGSHAVASGLRATRRNAPAASLKGRWSDGNGKGTRRDRGGAPGATTSPFCDGVGRRPVTSSSRTAPSASFGTIGTLEALLARRPY